MYQTHLSLFFLIVVLCQFAQADVYLHAMPGSNNRLDEANRDRNNANRLFDSQNNNRGGYNVQSYQFIAGSLVDIQWTNQHGCGVGNGVDCEIILQFMCDPLLRDGTTTQRIPNSPEFDANPEFGRHESYAYYRNCQQRERNNGLFTASQNLQGNRAQFTRQNPDGTRHGFECPEERDYYPYWLPTPWIDIAVLTDRPELCPFFQAESQNVKPKFFCDVNMTLTNNFIPISEGACVALRGNWTEVPAWGLPEPDCKQVMFTRENHLGIAMNSEDQATYTWTVPDLSSFGLYGGRCAFRIRYNISSNDYDGWDPAINASLNDRDGLKLNLARRFGSATPYPFENNPTVDIGNGIDLKLAINTAQIGRTFQDRSHRFVILPPIPASDLPAPDSVIYNLNVMGKRGNIVQTFPGQEYFYTPEVLTVTTNDVVHIQWSGSNTNPNNNDGQGQNGSDRHNMMEVDENDLGRVLPSHLANATLFNITVQSNIQHLHALPGRQAPGRHPALTDPFQLGGEMSELDDAGTYFSGRLFTFTRTGTKHYMNSRNNNFSNRQQKATITVKQGSSTPDIGVIVGLSVTGALVAILLAIGAYAAYQHANAPAPTSTTV